MFLPLARVVLLTTDYHMRRPYVVRILTTLFLDFCSALCLNLQEIKIASLKFSFAARRHTVAFLI